ncbi:MAG: GldG family protein [Minicystis sp.]
MERKTKARAETGIYLLVVAAILVVANLVSIRAYKRIDVTKNERFSLSKGSARLVAEGLSKDLDVTIYVTRGLPKHEAFIQDLTDLMNEYERAASGKLHYTIVEPKTDDERAKAKEDGMQEAAFGEGSKTGKDQALISKGFMGMSFKYGSEKEAIPIMSPDQSQGLEFWITNKIREIRDRADNKFQKIGIITGKDEIKLSEPNLVAAGGRGGGPTMKGIMEQALPFYKFEDVDLQNGDAEINKELVGVIITQPGKDFSEKELRRIDQFLMSGNKAVAIFASAVNLKASDAAMKAELNLRGLDKLLDGYGVEMKKDAVFDWARPAVVRVMTQGLPVVAGHPATVLTQYDSRAEESTQFLDQSFPGFFRMEELVFPFPSTLVPHADKQPGATMKVVARTTPRATVATSDTVEMKPARGELKPQGDYGQRAIAVVVEGKLKSAFAGKSGDGIEAPAESKDKSRLLVVSSSQFLANPYARSGNAPPMPPQLQMMGPMGGDEELMMISQPYAQQYLTGTILAFKNTLDWMGGDSDLIAASAKLIGEPNLTYLDIQKPKEAATDAESAKRQEEETAAEITKVQQRVQWTMTLFPAAVFALFGILRWRRREALRSAITLD